MSTTVREIMSRGTPKRVRPDDSIRTAAEMMKKDDIGSVLVSDGAGDEEAIGILTDRDIVVRCVAEGRDLDSTRVSDICSDELISVSPDDALAEAVKLMREKAIRRLPVMDDGVIVSVLSLGDLALARDPSSALAAISAAPPDR